MKVLNFQKFGKTFLLLKNNGSSNNWKTNKKCKITAKFEMVKICSEKK